MAPGMTLNQYQHSKNFMLVYYGVLYCMLWYDWATTLIQEYQKIWKSKSAPVKFLYILNRYAPLMTSIFVFSGFGIDWTVEKCNKYIIGWEAALPTIGAAAGGALLLLRCHAIWARSNKILAFLLVIYSAKMAGLIYLASTHITTLPRPEELAIGPCIPSDTSATMMAYCLIPLAYDMILCGLFLYRAFRLRSEFPGSGVGILQTIINHGSLYVVGVFVVNALHLIWMMLANYEYHTPYINYGGGYVCYAFTCIFSARLVLATKTNETGTTALNAGHSKPYSSSRPYSTNPVNSGKHLVSDVPLSIFTASTNTGGVVSRDEDQTDLEMDMEKVDLSHR